MAATFGILMASARGKDEPAKSAGSESKAVPSNRMRLEHTGLNVADPIKMAQWYVEHLGMKVLR
jgi:catechol-2,3-dioxygenase